MPDCGSVAADWVDSTLGSVWSGATGHNNDGITVVFSPILNVSGTVFIINVPGVGTWGMYANNLRWTAAIEGFIWHFEIHSEECDGNKVTKAHGSATDANGQVYAVDLTRTL